MDDSDVLNQLDAYLAGDADETGVLVIDEALVIEGEQQVQAMLRKRRRLVEERERVRRVASAEVERIEAFVADRTHGIDNALVWIERGLEQWTRRMNESDPRRKSWAMPSGTLQLRAPGAAKVVVEDREAFIEWAHADKLLRGSLLRQPPTPEVEVDKATVKATLALGPATGHYGPNGEVIYAAVDDGGEVVPGVVFTKPAQATFSVTHPAQDDPNINPPKET